MPSSDCATPATTVLAPVALSWLGLVVHNGAELGPSRLLGLETIGPTVVPVLLACGLLIQMRRSVEWLLMGWAVLQLVGGGLLSVLPLPRWPYDPGQSLGHYGVHALYALLQLPLLILVTRRLRRRRTAVRPPAGQGSCGAADPAAPVVRRAHSSAPGQ